jgi:hypothetical protein
MVKSFFAAFFIVAVLVLTTKVEAQPRPSSISGEISGEVRDQRGDLIVGAQVRLTGATNSMRNAESDARGQFRFDGLTPGDYTLKVAAQGFTAREERVALTSDSASRRLAVTLYPAIRETIEVTGDRNTVSLDPDRAAGAQLLKEEQLRLTPDDPDQFMVFLQLLSTSSGSAPGQATVTVDSFTHEGRLPPKSAIREVRINSNIFSAEYDKPPYRGGRIDIYTKPGASSFHGSGFFHFNNAALNARDVFAPTRAPVTTRRYGLQFGGPIMRQRAGFLIDIEARDINEAVAVNAVALNRALSPAPFTANVATPKLLLVGSARADWQATPAHAFIARYDVNRDRSDNQGAGGFDLPARAYDRRNLSQNLRFSGTSAIDKNLFNEARVGFTFNHITQHAASGEPTITVLGAFTDGGASIQSLSQDEWRFEFTDNLSYVAGRHNLKFGAQILGRRLDDAREENFNGSFVFGGAVAPQLDADGRVVTGADAVNISGLEQYRRALLGLPGGAPTRFSISRGDPGVAVSQWTWAGFVQDEWSLRQDMLVSLGLRYEAQTTPSDGMSLGPRIGVGYSPDKKRHWALRARAGLFYDRIAIPLAVETLRLDGRRVQQVIIDSPSFTTPFVAGATVEQIPTVRRLNPALRPPTSFQAQAGFERQFRRGWKLDVSHYWTRGWAALRSRNLNAPLVSPGGAPSTAPRPFGVKQNILQFESSGSLAGRVLFIGVNQSSRKRVNVFSGYLWFDFHTDADHPFQFPQSSYDLRGEWARPFWQAKHRGFLVAIINLPGQWSASSELNLASGTPFNITSGRDNNGDGTFNDRPSVTDIGDTKAVATRFGALDPLPVNGSLRRNAGSNPFNATLDFNLSWTFGFGSKAGRNEKRYQMTFNARANNLLNHANLFGVDGALNSPFFGRPNSARPARRVELGARFNF